MFSCLPPAPFRSVAHSATTSQRARITRIGARLLIVITASLCLYSVVRAEEPEEIGVPYLVESGTGKLLPLERQRINEGIHLKGLGFGGGSTSVTFAGKSSPVRVKASPDLHLTIRFASMPPTPSAFINLDTLTAKKDTRESITSKAGPFGFGAKSMLGSTEIQLKFAIIDSSTLSIQSVTPLPPGEYVVTLKDTPYGYLFSVIP